MREVSSDVMTDMLQKMAVTKCEKFLNRKNDKGETFLHQVIRMSRANGCEDLEDYQEFYDGGYNSHPNRDRGNYHKLLETLLMNGANPDIKTSDGKTCLHLATEKKYTFDDQY